MTIQHQFFGYNYTITHIFKYFTPLFLKNIYTVCGMPKQYQPKPYYVGRLQDIVANLPTLSINLGTSQFPLATFLKKATHCSVTGNNAWSTRSQPIIDGQ